MPNFYYYILILFLISCNSNASENNLTSTNRDESVEIISPETNEDLTRLNDISTNNIIINGEIEGAENLNYFLYYIGDQQPYILDTCKIISGQFSFETPLPYEYNLLGIGSSAQNLMLVIGKSNDNITIKANQSELPGKYSVNGSEYSSIVQSYNEAKVELINQYQSIQKKSMSSNNADKHQKELEKITSSFNILKNNFIEENKGSPVLVMALQDIRDYVNEMPQLKIIEEAINQYFPHTVFKQNIEQILSQIAMQQAQIEQQKQELSNAGISIGKPAPELDFPDVNGNNISLSSLKGKVILLDFWASWCGPCRKENPFVVNLYNKYKTKGFEIYSLSLDNNKDKWINAIQQDGLIWKNHVSDLKGWQSAGAAKYMVRSIPQTFLIDKNGIIIDIGLRGEALENRLNELL